MIELINLNYTVKKQEIISNFNFNFENGKCYGLIGSSGCGKTTLIKLISDVLTKTSGTVNYSYFENMSTLLEYPKLTTVFQDFRLFPHLTIYENIILPLKTNKLEIDDVELNKLCNLFSVSAVLKNKPFEISTGQRQRVAFIRAVLLKPKILLLDEITSSLDIESVQIMTNYLKKLKCEGTTLIIATHSITLCKNICDQYLFVDNGILNSFGSVNDLEDRNNHNLTDRLTKFLNSY
jgi:ABC-type multidrug transport system ATPase subunit